MHLHGGEDTEDIGTAEKFERLLALQIAGHQRAQGRFFYLEDSLESALWSTKEWRDLRENADVQFLRAEGSKRAAATNLLWEVGMAASGPLHYYYVRSLGHLLSDLRGWEGRDLRGRAPGSATTLSS